MWVILISVRFKNIENENSIIIIIIEHSSSYLNLWDFGVFHWSDGSKYTGDWQNNKMMGTGELTWHDGKWYIGEFINDKRNGKWFVCKRIFIFVTLIFN